MNHFIFSGDQSTYSIALLVRDTQFSESEIRKHYIDPYAAAGGNTDDIIAISLATDNGKVPAKVLKSSLTNIHKICKHLQVNTLWIADAAYFKKMVGIPSSKQRGYVAPSVALKEPVIDAGRYQCISLPNYAQIFYDDTVKDLITESVDTLVSHVNGTWVEPGTDFIQYEYYPQGLHQIENALRDLYKYPRLAVDIEAFSLRFNEAGIGTISFAWSKDSGIAFACDYSPWLTEQDGMYGEYLPNEPIRKLLREFFDNYPGILVWQNGYSYDIKVLIYVLYMKETMGATQKLLDGLKAFYWNREYHDTKIITYLATNTTAGNVLGLKPNAAEHTGNYAEDVADIRTVPLNKLLRYNLGDAVSTIYVMDKNYPVMVADNQLPIYEQIFLPSMPVLTQTELTGMSMHMPTIKATEAAMEQVRADAQHKLANIPELLVFREHMAQLELDKDYDRRAAKAKNPDRLKVKTLNDFAHVEFNPNSNIQVGILLHDFFNLPVLDKTKTGQPATGSDSLKKLKYTLMADHGITDKDLE